MSNPVIRFATVQGQNIHWFLQRNCSVRPVQLAWQYASLCVVSLGIGTFFWWHGATLVLPLAWLELAAVGAAFVVHALIAVSGRGRSVSVGRHVRPELRPALAHEIRRALRETA